MESSVRTLQSQLDNSNRKTSTAETILKNITQERDSAVSQLGVAYFTIEQLKVENEDLKDENTELKTRLGQLSEDHVNQTQQWTAKEEAQRRNFDRRTEAVQSMIEENGVQLSGLQDKNDSKSRRKEGAGGNVDSNAHKEANTMFDLLPGRKNREEPSKGGRRTVQIDDSQDSEDSVYEVPKAKGKDKAQPPRSARNAQGDETSQNLTYLSFLEVNNPFMLSSQPLTLGIIER